MTRSRPCCSASRRRALVRSSMTESAGGVVDPHRRGGHVVHDRRDLRPVGLVHEPGLQRARVDPGLGGEEAQRELLVAHLEAEDRDLLRLADGGVLRRC